jgi:anti-sigma factor RsiW
MNECRIIQAKFTEYLDGRLNGKEMQRIGFHLDHCPECAREWASLKQTQALISQLGPVLEPKDLLLRIRVAVSQERAGRSKGLFHDWDLAWKNTLGPFLLQVSAGFASSVLLLGTVVVLVSMFAQPESAQAVMDEPIGMSTAPRLLYLSSSAGDSGIGADTGTVVVEAYINGEGQVYDYRIVSGQNDKQTRSQVENVLLYSAFEPARFLGRPVRGLAVLSFVGISVHG